MVWYGVVWYGIVWYDVVWCGMVKIFHLYYAGSGAHTGSSQVDRRTAEPDCEGCVWQ